MGLLLTTSDAFSLVTQQQTLALKEDITWFKEQATGAEKQPSTSCFCHVFLSLTAEGLDGPSSPWEIPSLLKVRSMNLSTFSTP